MIKILTPIAGALFLAGGTAVAVPGLADQLREVVGATGATQIVTETASALGQPVQAAGGVDAIKATQAEHQAKIDAGTPLAEAAIGAATRAELAAQGASVVTDCPAEIAGLSRMLVEAGSDTPLVCGG